MEISEKLKEKFCKNSNVPIKVFKESYFSERISLYDRLYGTIDKWINFITEVSSYENEQDYIEHCNFVKDFVIDHIKNSAAFQKFNECDINKYPNSHVIGLPKNNIFKLCNDGKPFISIDMEKANFSALQHYDRDIFDNADTWEDFIGQFTNDKHIIESKYIRQVIMGNLNSKRQIAYEKYLMDQVLDSLIGEKGCIPLDLIASFLNDEIIIKIPESYGKQTWPLLKMRIEEITKEITIPLKIEIFTIHSIANGKGYYKKFFGANKRKKVELKCMDNYMIPFVIRKMSGEEICENDKIFCYEGLLSKLLEIPSFEVPIFF